jgi:transposase
MQAYSLDLRQRIAQACAEPGARQAQVAARFSVSVAFVGKLLRRQWQTGQLAGRGGPARCLCRRAGVVRCASGGAAGCHAGRIAR